MTGEPELTDIIAADALGKATTSAAVQDILAAPDPWGALTRAVAALDELDSARQAGDSIAEELALDAYNRACEGDP